MRDALAFTLGAISCVAVLAIALRRLRSEHHVRENFHGRSVLATGGIALVASLVVAWFIARGVGGDRVALAMLGAGIAMAAFGYVDDVYGDRRAGGLIGHTRALLRGKLTTGMLKAGGGAVVGLAAAWTVGWRDVWVIVAGAAVALSSNLANLFDLRPGRVIKLWLPMALVLVVVANIGSGRVALVGLGGGVAILLVYELRERVMLGDTGAGLLGAVLGVGAIAVLGHVGVVVFAVVLLALTLVSERVSFTKVIENVAPLRYLDGIGRLPD